jgi:hypothetical protein
MHLPFKEHVQGEPDLPQTPNPYRKLTGQTTTVDSIQEVINSIQEVQRYLRLLEEELLNEAALPNPPWYCREESEAK